jgi:hypothetical protein
MPNLLHLPENVVAENVGQKPRPCATPGCQHGVNESWDDAGLHCAACVIEGELYDRDGRWDNAGERLGTRWRPS